MWILGVGVDRPSTIILLETMFAFLEEINIHSKETRKEWRKKGRRRRGADNVTVDARHDRER
jgi:hypothetical protein